MRIENFLNGRRIALFDGGLELLHLSGRQWCPEKVQRLNQASHIHAQRLALHHHHRQRRPENIDQKKKREGRSKQRVHRRIIPEVQSVSKHTCYYVIVSPYARITILESFFRGDMIGHV